MFSARLQKNMSNTLLNTKYIDLKYPLNDLTDLIVPQVHLGNFTHEGIFDSLDVLGAHSGKSEPSGFINHHRAPCRESRTKDPPPKAQASVHNLCFASMHSSRHKCAVF